MKLRAKFARSRTLLCAASVASLLAGAPAFAQQGKPDQVQAEEAAAPGEDETIIVTARRRTENLQDVPIAVSAFNAGQLQELQADNLSGIQHAVPNLYLDQGDASNAVIYIRGVGQNDSLAFADPGVGVYVDDVFIARSQAAFLELFDVERVEVLRGPQGTLYGRNTIGGAVKFVSTPPPDSFDAYLEAGVGNYNAGILKGRIGGPLVDGVLRGKVAFAASRRDGFNTNLFTGQDDGDQRSFSGRASLSYTPTDKLEFLLSIDGRLERPDTSRNPTRETSVTGAPTVLTRQTFQPTAPFVVDVNANDRSNISAFGATLKTRYKISDAWGFESITAYRSFDFDLALDTDGSPLRLLDVFVEQDQYQFSQELRASYDNGGRIAATAGVYYFRDRDLTFSGVDNVSATIFGLPVTLFGFSTSSIADTLQVTNSYAAFADASFKLTDELSFSAGLRYTFEDRRSGRRFEQFFNPGLSVIQDTPPFLQGVGVPGAVISGEADFDALTPKVAFTYEPSKDVTLYASVSRGFKSGGFDGRANSNFGFQPFLPEFVWSYEGGVKSSALDGRLRANLTYFYNDYSDLQVTSFGADPVTGVFVSRFTNAASARTQGAELELFARPTKRLTFTGNVGFLDADYRSFDILVGGVPTDVTDRRLVNAPRWNAAVGGTYEQPLSKRFVGQLHVDASYRGENAVEITDSPALRQPRTTLINALFSVRTASGRWELQGGVRNLLDEQVRVQGFNLSEFPGVQVGFFAAPRTYDFRLIYRY